MRPALHSSSCYERSTNILKILSFLSLGFEDDDVPDGQKCSFTILSLKHDNLRILEPGIRSSHINSTFKSSSFYVYIEYFL